MNAQFPIFHAVVSVEASHYSEPVDSSMAVSAGTSTIMAASYDTASFTEIVRLLEEEKYALERKIDIMEKVCIVNLLLINFVAVFHYCFFANQYMEPIFCIDFHRYN